MTPWFSGDPVIPYPSSIAIELHDPEDLRVTITVCLSPRLPCPVPRSLGP